MAGAAARAAVAVRTIGIVGGGGAGLRLFRLLQKSDLALERLK